MLRLSVRLALAISAVAGPAAAQGVAGRGDGPVGVVTTPWDLRSGTDSGRPGGAGSPTASGQPAKRLPGSGTAGRLPIRGSDPAAAPGRMEWLGASLDPPDPLSDPVGANPAAGRGGEARIRAGAAAPTTGSGSAGRVGRTAPGAARLRGAAPETTGAVRPVAPVAPSGPQQSGRGAALEDPYAEADPPFAPPGIAAGGFVLLPSIEAGAGATSNVQGGRGGRAGSVVSVTPALKGRSDWSRHALDFEVTGTYLAYPGDRDYDKPTANARAAGRIDLSEGMRFDLRGAYSMARGASGSAENPAGTAVPSTVETFNGSAAFTRDVGLVWASLRGEGEASRYSGGTLAGGGAIPAANARDNERYLGALRGGFHLSPALSPYIEGQVTRRVFVPVAGARSTADGAGIKAGVELDFGPILRGDLSAGWSTEEARFAGLPDLAGVTLDGSIVWSPTRLTTVTLTAKTAFEPTTVAGASGAITRSLGVTVAHEANRRLSLEAGATVGDRRYANVALSERTMGSTGTVLWRFSPYAQGFLRGQYDRFTPASGSDGYDVGTVTVGLRLQR